MGRYDKRTPAERFYEKVEQPPYSAACWIWTAAQYSNGYGCMSWEKALTGAHRVSYIIHNGPITDGLQVLHRCDNKRCVNPEHLFLGTQKENLADMVEKGRCWQTKKTHCRRGSHPLSGDNLYINPTSGARVCLACQKATNHKTHTLHKRKRYREQVA